MSDPQFIEDIQVHLGLRCERDSDYHIPTWWVMSPTGVRLFKVGGWGEQLIGSVSTPEMFDVQGVDEIERRRRREMES